MYNPCRGGVRGGADQFTWDSVKGDKHRENYLGHSLKAPVGRWQKGKDLSWYAKDREDSEDSKKSEMAAIKKAEQEAMLIALGHKVVRKESQQLTKEEIKEALKRDTATRDEHNIERIDGVGTKSHRAALLTGINKDPSNKKDGIVFETHRLQENDSNHQDGTESSKKKSKNKKSKKHKKEKKKKKHYDSSDDSDSDTHKRERKSKRRHNSNENEEKYSPKKKHEKKTKLSYKHASSSDSEYNKATKKQQQPYHRARHDTSESD